MSNIDYNDNDSDPKGVVEFFDFGFTRFITNTWISIIWTICVFVILGTYGIALIAGLVTMTQNFGGGFMIMVMATIAAPLYLLLVRIGLEVIIVVFRIETHLRALRDK